VKKSKYKIAIFISGKGSNAKRLIEYFREHNDIEIAIIISNKSNSDVENICLLNQIDYIETSEVVNVIENKNIDLIVLAGYLKLIPNELISIFTNRIINIHPSLLPKFGGKGMYGRKVHQSVIESGEKESGITIHYVNQNYDEGEIIKQIKIKLSDSETPDTLESKIHDIELENFPKIIEQILCK
jgi:phosphoribosylglycinamide formyltransferase-1